MSIQKGTPIVYGRFNVADKSVQDIKDYLKSLGIECGDIKLHVTVIYSDNLNFGWREVDLDDREVKVTLTKAKVLGLEHDTVCLVGDSDELTELWKTFRDLGAAWSYPDFHAHVSTHYDIGNEEAERIVNMINEAGINLEIILDNWQVSESVHGIHTKSDGTNSDIKESLAERVIRLSKNVRL